jgi:hypothetical protein
MQATATLRWCFFFNDHKSWFWVLLFLWLFLGQSMGNKQEPCKVLNLNWTVGTETPKLIRCPWGSRIVGELPPFGTLYPSSLFEVHWPSYIVTSWHCQRRIPACRRSEQAWQQMRYIQFYTLSMEIWKTKRYNAPIKMAFHFHADSVFWLWIG